MRAALFFFLLRYMRFLPNIQEQETVRQKTVQFKAETKEKTPSFEM